MKFDKVKLINSYFRLADKSKIEELKKKVLFSDRQLKIFDLYYIQGQKGAESDQKGREK